MKKLRILVPVLFILTLPSLARAFCPICTVAVAGGLGLSRYLKIDDTVSGIWVGALILSGCLWFINWLKNKKKYDSKIVDAIILVGVYAITIYPLYRWEIIGHPLNKIFGYDKLIFGVIIGTIIFPISVWVHMKLKTKNHGKSYFPFQKVVIPLTFLIIASLIMYLVTLK